MLFSRNDSIYKPLRQLLRKNQTEAECILWQELRNRRFCGMKFYRQFGIGRYILDFYCEELKLAIELDGGHHSEPNQLEYDVQRTLFLEANSIRVIRFWNNDIKENMNGVMEKILEEVGKK